MPPRGGHRRRGRERNGLATPHCARPLLRNPEEEAPAPPRLSARGARPGLPNRRTGRRMTSPTHDASARQHSGGPSLVPGQRHKSNSRQRGSIIADVDQQIAELGERSIDELRLAWREMHSGEPPRGLSRDLLIRSLANQLQERTNGAMSRTVRRRMEALVRDFEKGGAPCDPAPMLKTGTTLVRQWRGHTHPVPLRDGGVGDGGE